MWRDSFKHGTCLLMGTHYIERTGPSVTLTTRTELPMP